MRDPVRPGGAAVLGAGGYSDRSEPAGPCHLWGRPRPALQAGCQVRCRQHLSRLCAAAIIFHSVLTLSRPRCPHPQPAELFHLTKHRLDDGFAARRAGSPPGLPAV